MDNAQANAAVVKSLEELTAAATRIAGTLDILTEEVRDLVTHRGLPSNLAGLTPRMRQKANTSPAAQADH